MGKIIPLPLRGCDGEESGEGPGRLADAVAADEGVAGPGLQPEGRPPEHRLPAHRQLEPLQRHLPPGAGP